MSKNSESNIRELLNNENFVHWIINPTTELELYWNNIMEKEPNIKNNIFTLKRIMCNLRVNEQALSSDDKDALWNSILEECYPTLKRAFYSHLWFKVSSVAAVIIFAIIGSFVFFNGGAGDVIIDYDKVISQQSDMKKSDHVYLMLSDNSKISINDGSEIIYDKQGNVYTNAQRIDNNGIKNKTALNQLIVPNGKTAEVRLCDGTKVNVNSGSRMVFPPVFNAKTREIYVDGEIFLKVTKNTKYPFVVKTDKMDVQVLGTSFNVSAYKNEEKQSVVLVMGSVAVKNKAINSDSKIVPNQMYGYEKSTGEINIKKVDVYDYICWQYGFLHFKSERLSTVLSKLQKYYDMKIDFDPQKIENIRVSGKLDLKDNVEHVLRIISATTPIGYQIQQNRIKINVKP